MSVTWHAPMISPDEDFDGAPLLRTRVHASTTATGRSSERRLCASALGRLRGLPRTASRVSDDVLSPGWSRYEWRLRYREYDVTGLLRRSAQTRARASRWATAGSAADWAGTAAARSTATSSRRSRSWRSTFADGHVQVVGTDRPGAPGRPRCWPTTCTTGRPSTPGCATTRGCGPGSTRPDWVRRARRRVRHRPAHAVPRTAGPSAGRARAGADLDLAGRAHAGRLRAEPRRLAAPARARSRPGSEITLRHAEVLEHDELGTRPLRSAKATDRFVLSGGGRRVRADLHLPRLPLRRGHGWPGRADRARTSRRSSSHSDLRRIGALPLLRPDAQPAARATSSGACAATSSTCPTDCPQRDERLGWTGDLAVFAPTAAFLFDVRRLPRRLAARPRRRAGARRRHGPVRRPRRPEVRRDPDAHPVRRSRPRSGATRRSGCPGRCGRPTATRTRCAGTHPRWRRTCAACERLLSPTRPVGHRLPVRRLARPDGAAGGPVPGQGRPGRGGHGLLLPHARARDPGRPDCSARPTSRGVRASCGSACGRRSSSTTSNDDGIIVSDCPTVYALAIVFGLLDERASCAGRGPAGRARAEKAGFTASRPGSPARRTSLDALTSTGHLDDGVPAAARARLPVLALPGDDGRDHDLGALGLDAARRQHQPGRDDQLQPLRPRRGRGLDAPRRRRHRPARARLPAGAGRPAPGGGITSADSSLETPYGQLVVRWTADGEELSSLDDRRARRRHGRGQGCRESRSRGRARSPPAGRHVGGR